MATPELDPARIARAAAGDKAELEGLLRDIEPELRASISIRPHWRRSLEPEDVLQVSFLEAFLRIASLRDTSPAGFRAWIGRIVRNNLLDALRALGREKRPDERRRVTRGAGGESARTLLSALVGDDPTVSRRAVMKEDVERLHAAIARLPASYRRVVQEIDIAERSVADVAAEMGKSRGAVHLLRSRAHERLGELLRE